MVEDNDDSRQLLQTILTRAGAVVRVAESAATALRILAGEWPDIVISDIEMPGEDGYSLIRKIRLQEPPSRRVPAIALTAYTRSADRVRALAAGFQTHDLLQAVAVARHMPCPRETAPSQAPARREAQ